MSPNEFISTIRESDSYIRIIYLKGGCYQFYKVLKTIFDNAEPYINADKSHIVTMINNEFYDITGKVEGEYQPLTHDDKLMCESWSFSRNYWLTKECPNCDEPIPVTS